jgi:hypothetical protein
MTTISQSTQFSIRELVLSIPETQVKYDLSSIFQELNLFDNLFMPSVSGNIQILDASNLLEKLKFDGNEKLKIKIDKGSDSSDFFNYEREFVFYKISNIKNVNLTAKTYTLHFCTEEFILSEQKKISQSYTGKYSDIVRTILNDHLKVPFASPDRGKAGMGVLYPTTGVKDFIIPSLTPLDAVNWITKRSVSENYQSPSFVFYEVVKMGFNFAPLDYLLDLEPRVAINFKPKNLGEEESSEFLGARSMKILSGFSLIDGIRDGAYAGKFIGFDTLTKTIRISNVKTVYEKGVTGTSLTTSYTKENVSYDKMYDSRVVIYPYSTSRMDAAYIRDNDPARINFMDNSEEYIFQRKSIFTNLMQKRIEILMPGNFGLYSGMTVNLTVPKYSSKENDKNYDSSLSGKYIVLGTRHIIRYDRHETLIEVATDNLQIE